MTALFQPFPMRAGHSAQLWRHRPVYLRPRHFHEEPELNMVVRGTARLGVGNAVVSLTAGEAIVYEPGVDHALLDASPDLEMFVVALKPELAERLGTRKFGGRHALEHSDLAAFAQRASALETARDHLVVEASLADLFSEIAHSGQRRRVTARRALEELQRAPSFTAGQLGRRLGVASSVLSREFHRELGLTLVEYRARLRLMQFVRLVDSGCNLSRAALDADFGSYAQCYRVFQRALGCGPRDYFAGRRVDIDDRLAFDGRVIATEHRE